MADFDEMTPAKWGLVGGALVLIVVAIGLVYHFTKGPDAADIPALGDKGQLLRDATGPGTDSTAAGVAGEPTTSPGGNAAKQSDSPDEPKTIKGRRAESDSLGP